MYRTRFHLLVALLLMLSVSASCQSVVTEPVGFTTLTFQGRLARPDGTPVADTSTQSLTFRLFAAPTGGTKLWEQTFNGNVAVRNGTFAVGLDFGTGYVGGNTRASVFLASHTPYLEIRVGSDAPLLPRQPVTSVAYALYSGTALTVTDGSITLSNLAPNVLSFPNLSGTIGAAQIAAGSITGDKIASGTITSNNLNTSLQQTLGLFSYALSIPSLAGSIGTGSNPVSVAVSGNYAYVVNLASNSLQVFNVSNPASPTLIGSATTRTSPVFVTVSGNYAYVVNIGTSPNYTESGLQVFDVSNPTLPTARGAITTGIRPQTVAIAGNYAYVGSDAFKLQVFDISNPDSLILRGSVDTAGEPVSVAAAGNYAYVAEFTSAKLEVFDASNPNSPVLKGSVSTGAGSHPFSVATAGSYAYVNPSIGLKSNFKRQ